MVIERLSITFTSNGKREFVPRDQVSHFCRLRFVISTLKLVVSRNPLSIRMFLSCLYLLFSVLRNSQLESDVCRLPYTWSLNFLIYKAVVFLGLTKKQKEFTYIRSSSTGSAHRTNGTLKKSKKKRKVKPDTKSEENGKARQHILRKAKVSLVCWLTIVLWIHK